MIDITKDEFWENKYQEVEKKKEKDSKIKDFIKKHKIVTVLIVSLSLLITVNTVLIYNFLKIISSI